MPLYIKHLGTVESINDLHLQVRIIQTAACSACSAKQLCKSSESKEKLIDVYDDHANSYKVGDRVVIHGTLSQGMNAAVLAYCVPLVLLLGVLFISVALTGNEAFSALIALLSLLPYGLLLYLLRAKLSKKFSFTLKPKK